MTWIIFMSLMMPLLFLLFITCDSNRRMNRQIRAEIGKVSLH